MPTVLHKPRSAALESHLKGSVLRWLANQGCMPFEELSVSWGIVDALGIRVDMDRVLARLKAGHAEPVGDYRTWLVLLAVPMIGTTKSISRTQLAAMFTDTIGSGVERIIQKLLRKRMLNEISPGRLARTFDAIPFHREIVAVELKLTRVEEALAQARRHKTIATVSYVGLPLSGAEKVAESNRRDDFVRAGVGLLAVDDEECAVLIPAGDTAKEREPILELAAAEQGWRRISEAIHH